MNRAFLFLVFVLLKFNFYAQPDVKEMWSERQQVNLPHWFHRSCLFSDGKNIFINKRELPEGKFESEEIRSGQAKVFLESYNSLGLSKNLSKEVPELNEYKQKDKSDQELTNIVYYFNDYILFNNRNPLALNSVDLTITRNSSFSFTKFTSPDHKYLFSSTNRAENKENMPDTNFTPTLTIYNNDLSAKENRKIDLSTFIKDGRYYPKEITSAIDNSGNVYFVIGLVNVNSAYVEMSKLMKRTYRSMKEYQKGFLVLNENYEKISIVRYNVNTKLVAKYEFNFEGNTLCDVNLLAPTNEKEEIKLFGFLRDFDEKNKAFSVVIDQVSGVVKKHTFFDLAFFKRYNPASKIERKGLNSGMVFHNTDCELKIINNPSGGAYIIVLERKSLINPTYLNFDLGKGGSNYKGLGTSPGILSSKTYYETDADKSIYKYMNYESKAMTILSFNKEGEFVQTPLNLNWEQKLSSYEAYFGGYSAHIIGGNLIIILNDNTVNHLETASYSQNFTSLQGGTTFLLTISPLLNIKKTALKNDIDPLEPVLAQPEKAICIGIDLFLYYTTIEKQCKFYCIKKVTLD
jgi:hypothetical protein